MIDSSDSSSPDSLSDLLDVVLEQAEEIASLDAARAEAWASDVLSLVAEADHEPESLVEALVSAGDDRAATALAALGDFADVPPPAWSGPPPSWVGAIGTSRCEGAWVLREGDRESVAFRFVDVNDERHVLTIDLVAGAPETIGEVMVGPGDLLEALREDDAGIDSEDASPAELAVRCVEALEATRRPTLTAVVNGRLLLRRLAELTAVDIEPPLLVADDVPELPERDPEDDAYALEILTRALGEPAAADDAVVSAIAAVVAPNDLAPLAPAERDAVLLLEWADWLGAVIGLVRAGEGCLVDGSVMVDLVNRCPEVTTTIPKADRPRIEWAFDTLIASWPELGLLADDRLTTAALTVLPAALRRAWS